MKLEDILKEDLKGAKLRANYLQELEAKVHNKIFIQKATPIHLFKVGFKYLTALAVIVFAVWIVIPTSQTENIVYQSFWEEEVDEEDFVDYLQELENQDFDKLYQTFLANK